VAIIDSSMIASCGMDCALCIAHVREKKPCNGCEGSDAGKPRHCVECAIKLCEKRPGEARFCFACEGFPCARLAHLDKRYRTKYGMSMIENLESIRARGLESFVANEAVRWACPGCGELICVHRDTCLSCGRVRTVPVIAKTGEARGRTDGTDRG